MKLLKTITTVAAVSCFAITSQATLLLPGGNVPVSTQLLPGPAPIATLVDNLSGAFAGTITSWVVSGDAANPNAGGLSFYYQLTLAGGSTAAERFTVAGFGGVNTLLGVDVEAISLGSAWGTTGALLGGVAPSGATRSPIVSDNGNVVGFEYPGNGILLGGTHTELLVVHTSATTWLKANGGVIDGTTDNVTVLAPVPEPTTIIAGALLLLPFGASTLRMLRRKNLVAQV
jgi:hypothetical protein